MEEMTRSRFDIKNREDFEITSVGSFLEKINKLKEKDEDYAQKYFFRGQQVEFWDISSSICREEMLNSEHQLLKEPLEKFPSEFKNLSNTFDLMTKCQHYGLCTRLLDLTTNPLVALYFACQKFGEQKYEKDPEQKYSDDKEYEEIEPWGIIFYKKDYPIYSDDKKVKIITELAKYNLQYENSLNDILKRLQKNGIITEKEAEEWFGLKYQEFIDIIQDTYVVQPTYSNTRLIAQSGAFLLPGMFSFEKNNMINSVITKCKGSLRNEFEKDFFFINGDNKERILDELSLCNINESTLFPELEHQLRHIKTLNKQGTQAAPDFVQYSELSPEMINDLSKAFTNYSFEAEDENIEKFKTQLGEYIYSNSIFKNFEEIIYKKIVENLVVDWYKKDSIKSKIRLNITKELISQNYDKEQANEMAKDLLEEILKIYANILSEK